MNYYDEPKMSLADLRWEEDSPILYEAIEAIFDLKTHLEDKVDSEELYLAICNMIDEEMQDVEMNPELVPWNYQDDVDTAVAMAQEALDFCKTFLYRYAPLIAGI